MKVIKRNGSEVDFDINKIITAISKANDANVAHELSDSQIREAAEYIQYKCDKLNRAASVEEIQDMVENQEDAGLALNCPNCGAPLPGLGAKKCIYCDTPIVEYNLRIWNFSRVEEA